jgi:hypothetical protein
MSWKGNAHRTIAWLCLLGASACATTLSRQASTIVEVEEKAVEGCAYVGIFNGTSGWGGTAATELGATNAKNAVFERAAKKGATHVVFVSLTGGMFTKATGKAYRCAVGTTAKP